MNWLYNEENITDISQFPKDAIGFLYEVEDENGKKYIGKKALYHNKKRKLSKKDLLKFEGKVGRKPTHERLTKESDWKTYYGSHKEIKKLIKEGNIQFTRKILKFAFSKKQLTYLEAQLLFKLGVLENSIDYYNDNILAKFYRKDFILT